MNRALSLIVPVRNVQSTLRTQVEQLLEVLPDVVPRFEIVVVDDGSTDLTTEVAYDLSRQFPQVRIIHNRHAGGQAECVRLGMEQADGEVVIVRQLAQSTPAIRQVAQLISEPPAADESRTGTSAVPRPAIMAGRRSTFSSHVRNVVLGE